MTRSNTQSKRKVIIVGGVAGGASCAARLRRLDEHANIVLVERGPNVSYANCGLPYHVGGVIEKESSLLVASVQMFKQQFAVDVRVNCEAVAISPQDRTVQLRDVSTGEITTEAYDQLVLAPGAASVRPPLPGIDLPGIFHVRTVPDARAIREWLERGTMFLAGMYNYSGIQFAKPQRHAVVVGGGFIGLEMAENLVHRGLRVTVIERLDQVLAPLDSEFSQVVGQFLKGHGVALALGESVAQFCKLPDGSLEVQTQSGKTYPADMVVLALGVRPETALARTAGLEIGSLGGIRVDAQMRTSDEHIFAVGDAVEVRNSVTGQWNLLPLAGPANRQGRIAADAIVGRDSRYRGTQGTAIVGLFGGAAAWTGLSEKALKALGDTDYQVVQLFPNSHAGYYPGAKMISLKLIYRRSDSRLLGAQAMSEDAAGVDKRISALAMALQMGATMQDLEDTELCYAPQFGSAKDPVNFAGMVAGDIQRGDMPTAHWDRLGDGFLLDVRQPAELAVESVAEAVNIPLGELRSRLGELPCEREILIICRSGQRAYYAARMLMQRGFRARVLSGGMLARTVLSAATPGALAS